jgi:hypothetical protein
MARDGCFVGEFAQAGDETAATAIMTRRDGRRRRGLRLRCGVPHGHYKAITFVFGLREASSRPRRLTTP